MLSSSDAFLRGPNISEDLKHVDGYRSVEMVETARSHLHTEIRLGHSDDGMIGLAIHIPGGLRAYMAGQSGRTRWQAGITQRGVASAVTQKLAHNPGGHNKVLRLTVA